MPDVQAAGCPRVIFVPFGYKPTVHYPEKPAAPEEHTRFDSDVVFIGGCDADRVPYFEALVKGLPNLRLHLYGGYWDRHSLLRRYYRGFALGRHYRLALGAAKIALNLVRRANRDRHVMRSFEIPACGAFMLAERTEEHLEWFEEGKEAAYFDSPDELVEKVRYYLSRDDERQRIAEAGHRKVTLGGHTYKARLIQILEAVRALND
jgi:glycosyltransferase involved in cell wall biosynthesis